MTINGPAPMLLIFYECCNRSKCEKYIIENNFKQKLKKNQEIYKKKDYPTKIQGDLPEGNNGLGLMLLGVTGDQVLPLEVYNEIKIKTLAQVRGTVQADILKEDQAQNTCIFSTEFALRLMGDVQEYFIKKMFVISIPFLFQVIILRRERIPLRNWHLL
jgi:methylmalonyl-CoA mutase